MDGHRGGSAVVKGTLFFGDFFQVLVFKCFEKYWNECSSPQKIDIWNYIFVASDLIKHRRKACLWEVGFSQIMFNLEDHRFMLKISALYYFGTISWTYLVYDKKGI